MALSSEGHDREAIAALPGFRAPSEEQARGGKKSWKSKTWKKR